MSARACWRVDHHGVHDLEVDLRADTTVGEVAVALRDRLSPAGVQRAPAGDRADATPLTLIHAGAPLPPALPAGDAAAPCGATVSIGVWQGDGAAPAPSPPAPAHLVRDATRVALHYGHQRPVEGLELTVGHRIVVRATGAQPVLVDGSPVRDTAEVDHGALVRCGAWTATLRRTGALHPPPPGGPWRDVASRRAELPGPLPEAVELPAPPDAVRPPGFPTITALVPLAMGLAIWLATDSAWAAGFMLFTVVWVVAAGVESRRESRLEDRFRVERFREDLAAAAAELERCRELQEQADARCHPSIEELSSWLDPLSRRLWERTATHPAPVQVRLGDAMQAPCTRAELPAGGRPELRAEAVAVCAAHGPTRRPVVVDLAATAGLAVVGPGATAAALADAVMVQLGALVPPDVVEIDGDPMPAWAAWLPHRRGGAALRVRRVGPGSAAVPADVVALWAGDDAAEVPSSIGAVLIVGDPGEPAELRVGHAPVIEVDLEVVALPDAEWIARRLSPLRPVGAATPAATPGLRGLGLSLDAADVARAWRASEPAGPRHLAAPVGLGPGGGVVHLDLPVDGPHGLVAGTTGAGKSELLRTWLAALALRHPPHRLHLLLVDYKGGTSFGPLADLPHCAGVVTDLTPLAAARALSGLRAELEHRERLVAECGAACLDDLEPPRRPASLVVVVDEFATLVEDLPEAVERLVDLARRGRSLGVHIVLATQRPAGVVSDAIRANMSLRVALRVGDEDDSRDIVGSPDAARLPRSEPGRALVRLSHDELVELRVAHSAEAWPVPTGAVVRPLGSPPARILRASTGGTELDAAVAACREAARATASETVEPPWSPPLPPTLSAAVTARGDGGAVTVTMGETDPPGRRRRGQLAVTLRPGSGVLAVGAGGSGRSSTLATLAAGATRSGWHLHRIAADAGRPGGPSSANDVAPNDHELVHRLLRGLAARTEDATPTLLVVDDLAAFEQAQRRVEGAAALDELVSLAGDGRRRAVAVAVTALRRSDVPHELLAVLGERLIHRCVDGDAALAWDAPEELAEPSLPPGRIWHRGVWAQVVAPTTPPRATGVARLPTVVALHELGTDPDESADQRVLSLPVGLWADSLTRAEVDLARSHLLVAGEPGSGRSTALRTIAAAARVRGWSVIEGPATVRAPAAGEPPLLVLVDDVEELLVDPAADEWLEQVVEPPRRTPVRVVLAGDARALGHLHHPAIDRIRLGRTGLLLGPDGHDHDLLVHTDLRPRHDLPDAPGRGWLTQRGRAAMVQVATP